MKIETLIRKHYDLEIGEDSDALITELMIYEKGEDCEYIGRLLKHTGADGLNYFQWRAVYGPMRNQHGAAFTEQKLRELIKARAFG